MNPAIISALPVILDLIQKGVPAVINLINWVVAIRKVAQQNAAWTPDQEDAFMQALIATATNPIYMTDEALAAQAKA
jgi:hypothetical protein